MKTNLILMAIYALIGVISFLFIEGQTKWWILCMVAISLLFYLYKIYQDIQSNLLDKKVVHPSPTTTDTISQIILLSEENTPLSSWSLYGQISMVIGKDIGENMVNINLDNYTYSSMIEIHHAVLNYSGNDWYIEDISDKNGVSIEKSDGKKYKLAYGKPCKIYKGDIIYIALTRLILT